MPTVMFWFALTTDFASSLQGPAGGSPCTPVAGISAFCHTLSRMSAFGKRSDERFNLVAAVPEFRPNYCGPCVPPASGSHVREDAAGLDANGEFQELLFAARTPWKSYPVMLREVLGVFQNCSIWIHPLLVTVGLPQGRVEPCPWFQPTLPFSARGRGRTGRGPRELPARASWFGTGPEESLVGECPFLQLSAKFDKPLLEQWENAFTYSFSCCRNSRRAADVSRPGVSLTKSSKSRGRLQSSRRRQPSRQPQKGSLRVPPSGPE